MSNVVVILPTYNEVENITPLIQAIQKVFASLKQYRCSILVVDDNSPDGTAKKVAELQKQYSNIYLLTGRKKGLGAAYVRGMRYAIGELKADILFEMDADFSHDPKLIPQFLTRIKQGADFVVGSRYIKGGSIPAEWAWHRKIFSVVGNFIVRFGLMIPQQREWTNGYRAIKSEVFKQVASNFGNFAGYTFQVAFLHKSINAGFKVEEIPVDFVDRKYGKSKITPVNYISKVILYILCNSSFVRFGVVGMTGFIINLAGLEIFYRLGLQPGAAAAIGAEFAVVSNFFLNNFWSFAHKSIKQGGGMRKKFLQFHGVAVGAVLMQGLTVGLGTYFFGDQSRFLFLVLAIVVFVIPYSYFMYNRFIWKSDPK